MFNNRDAETVGHGASPRNRVKKTDMAERCRRYLFCALCLVIVLSVRSIFASALAWSNGGFSADPDTPNYGTHDWLAHHALDWVPDDLDFWIRNNLAIYLYGTELPDNANAPMGDGIGDTYLHHVYYRSDGRLQDDSAARRARDAFDKALAYLVSGDQFNASKWMGVATHYISDLSVFSHVMGKATDWGEEKHHQDYEKWVNEQTSRYESPFVALLKFDGKLEYGSAYDSALKLAYDTTFDSTGKGRTAKWMDDNYDPSNHAFLERVGESLSLTVNLLAEVIYAISLAAGIPEFRAPTLALSFVLLLLTLAVTGSLPRRVKQRSLKTAAPSSERSV